MNVFATPGDVFDEVLASPPTLLNWFVPTLLVSLAWLLLTNSTAQESISQTVADTQLDKTRITSYMLASLTVFVTTLLATCWSAFVLWFIGRIFLKTRFSYLKTLEIVGLVQMILVLGTVVTVLLLTFLGEPAARPALSFVALKLDVTNPLRRSLEVLNFFHLWSAALLTLGLSRLSGVAYKECAFWVFGFWIVFRLALASVG